jgi:two-component system, NarL family, sensor histidine kinase UhpB
MANSKLNRFSTALRLTIVYLVFSIAWMVLSNSVAVSFSGNNRSLLLEIESVKDIFFVLFSGLLLFFTSKRLYRNLQASLQVRNELLNKYKALNEATREAVIDHDLMTDNALINEQMKFLMGAESNLIRSFSEEHHKRIHPEDRSRVVNNFNDFLNRKNVMWQSNYRFQVKDGTYRDIINRGYVIRDKRSGKPLHIVQAMQDVTEIRNMKAVNYERQIRNRQSQARSIIKAQERERNRLAEELHDNVGQLLTVAKLLLEQTPEKEEDASPVTTSRKMVTKALEEIRQLSATMKPPRFTETTLNEAIQELIANIGRIKKFHFNVLIDPCVEGQLNNDQKVMIYRVVQEQLSNIIKYAEANNIVITIRLRNKEVYVRIKDDGIGFELEKDKTGIGLKNIRSRLKVFSGNLQVHSAPGQGCELVGSFSLIV